MPDSPHARHLEADGAGKAPVILVVGCREENAAPLCQGEPWADPDVTIIAPEELERRLAGGKAEGLDGCVCIIDLDMPNRAGFGLLRRLVQAGGTPALLAAAARPGIGLVVDAVRAGAQDVLPKPIDKARLMRLAAKLHRRAATDAVDAGGAAGARGDIARRRGWARLQGCSPAFVALTRLARRAAMRALPVWIEGPAGSGRTTLAQAIHEESLRADGPFVAVSCSGGDQERLEARLFGGLGDNTGRSGAFSAAAGGSLCLEDIGELPPALQKRLLAALEAGVVQDPDTGADRPLDLRLITTSSKPAQALMRAGRLDERLFLRLCAQPLKIPPLEARPADIPVIARAALDDFAQATGGRAWRLGDDALQLLEERPWPGQVRQLRALVIAAALLLPPGRDCIDREALRPLLGPADHAGAHESTDSPQRRKDEVGTIRLCDETGAIKPWRRLEREIIAAALELADGEMTRCARALRIGRSTLYRKIAAYRLARPGRG